MKLVETILNFYSKLFLKKSPHARFQLKSIDKRVLNTPSLAIGQARTETARMAFIVLQTLDETTLFLGDFNPDRIAGLHKNEQLIDRLQKEIMDFLVALSLRSITQDSSREAVSLMHMLNYLEQIGDQCEMLWRLGLKMTSKKITFSDIAMSEIKEISAITKEFLRFVVETLGQVNSEESKLKVMQMDGRVAEFESGLRNNHMTRLSTGECKVRSGLLFIDMLHCFKMIGDQTFSLSQIVFGKKTC
jgi:phosphate:Na+ symporter